MEHEISLDSLSLFVQTAQIGSLNQSAERYGIPKSKISRHIQELESRLGAQLFHRTSRGVQLTEAGQSVYHHVLRPLERLSELQSLLEDKQHALSGRIKISAPVDFSQTVFPDLIMAYQSKNPTASVELISINDRLDFDKTNLDMAFRIGRLKSSSLVQRKIGHVRTACVASPNYISEHGHPKDLIELNQHKCLAFIDTDGGQVLGKALPNPAFSTNSFPILKTWVLADRGIAYLPLFMVKNEIISGRLITILEDNTPEATPFYVLSRPNRYVSRLHRDFKDFALKFLQSYVESSQP